MSTLHKDEKGDRIGIGDLWRGKHKRWLIASDIVLVTGIKQATITNNSYIYFHYLDIPDDKFEWLQDVFLDAYMKLS